MKLKEMEKGSVFKGELPEGCKHCARGSKMVLLVTGKCEGGCWYCPLSKKKRNKSVVYADEKRVEDKEDILNEARSIGASGTGITGGDPLATEKTFKFIRLLKEEFGEDHHIHLYTQSTDKEHILELGEAGLDEIRFHPPVRKWEKMEETSYTSLLRDLRDKTELDVGIEIPSIPGKKEETVHLFEWLSDFVEFVNINELEFSSTNTKKLQKRGYEHKSDVSSAVKGSEELARELIHMDFDVSLHYCSLAFKDGVQLTNRIKRRAENTARESDIVTEEGTLIRGVIEAENAEELYEDLREKY
ncbi:MAG: radical SAM protein, partial [Candidatus Thermoplasmatota archaeon]|nr:radical SAM protein [Candidatus Thermoplasmatota archaeon]